MKSKRIIKETIKKETVPQGQKATSVASRKYKYNASSSGTNETTLKETTIEKSYQKTYKAEGSTDGNNKISITTNKVIISSNSKQGANSGFSSQSKIPTSTKEESSASKYSKYQKYKSVRNGEDFSKMRKFTKKETDLIIKIQKWWKRILARLNGYKIREKLRKEKGSGYVIKNREVVREKNSASSSNYKKDNSSGQKTSSKIEITKNYKITNNKNVANSNTSSYSNINSYSKYSTTNLQKNQNSKSYSNINNINSNVKKNLNINTNLTTSISQNYIQSQAKKSTTGYNQYLGSVSTSPSIKGKYIIETKKVEVFKRPKNYSASKTISKNTFSSMSEINRYEVKDIMKNIWNEESYCSTVESLCCLSDENKSNLSQNVMIFEEYEEEIRKLKSLLMEKDDEINNLMANLRETEKEMSVKYTTTINEYNKNKYDQEAAQIISMKKNNWNEINLPSPVSEIYIQSFKTNYHSGMAYNMEKYTQKIRKEESAQETISDSEAVLEIQEMNALSIISNKVKPKNICQHLQSLMILSKKNEEEEPLIFQKIEEINITSIVNKPRNQIQELDGLEIISMKKIPINISQNIDKICIKSLKKREVHNIIQELDGFEILKLEKGPQIAQCVDEFEIQREYDMLLVKPSWNSLQIQGSGLNLLAVSRDLALENQEIDEFEIKGKERPALSMQSPDKLTILKKIVPLPQKIQVLVPIPKNIIKKNERFAIKGIIKKPDIPKNSIKKDERFVIKGIKKKPEIKYIERFIKENKEVVPNEVEIIDSIQLIGEEKVAEVHIEEKEIEVSVDKKVEPNKIIKNDRFLIKGKVKEEYIQIKRKGLVENINKKIITKEEKKEEIKPEPEPEKKKPIILEIENIENIEINKEYDTPQPIVLEKIDWNKMTRPIKSTKLVIKSIPHVEKEKEEYVIENFAFNLTETNKRFKSLILFENGGFDLEGTKGMVLKEGPAQTIQIKKEQILLPSKGEKINIITEIKKEELKKVNENRLQINGQYKIKVDPNEKVKIIEKIIEKKINWNEFNIIEHNDLSLIHKKAPEKIVTLIKQTISSLSLIGQEMPQIEPQIVQQIEPQIVTKIEPQIIEKEKIVEKIVTITKNWDNLQAQRNAKFSLLGKPKVIKKNKLLVANGDKFFIQKESDDEIIYNDDYNTRKQKQKQKKEKKEKEEVKTQLIKEKEIVPRYQREIRAQIARVKESESETSSLSDIDVLAGIRNKNMIGQAELKKMANGYETKILNGEVVFTAKNGLGVDLGASQYQKQIKSKIGYTKKLSPSLTSNKMTGIEISFRNKKGGIQYEKMSATTGIIKEGNFRIAGDNNDISNNGQGSFKKQIIITSSQNGINGQSNLLINNRINQSPININLNGNMAKLSAQKSASNILIKKRESNSSNETPVSANINNDINQKVKTGKIIFNSKKTSEKQGQYSPNSTGNMSGKNNIVINPRKEYEKRIVNTGDRNITERAMNEKKKNLEINFKRSKVKNVELLRDYDS